MRITVKLADKEVVLGERSAQMLRFVAEHASEIEAIPVGQVRFHFSGRAVAPELVRHYRPMRNEKKELYEK